MVVRGRALSPWAKRLLAWLSGLLIAVLMVAAWKTGWRGFFSHPARFLTAGILAVYTAVAHQVTSGPSRGVRHAAESPWFHAWLQVVGLLMAVVPPLLESRGMWVLSGGDGLRYTGVVVLVVGTFFRLGPMLALGARFSDFVALQKDIRSRRAASTSGSDTRATSACCSSSPAWRWCSGASSGWPWSSFFSPCW